MDAKTCIKFNFDLVSHSKKGWDSKVLAVIVSFSKYLSIYLCKSKHVSHLRYTSIKQMIDRQIDR